MKSIDQKQDPAVDAINKRLKGIRFKATAGPHKVAVTFLHRTFAESDDACIQQIPGGGAGSDSAPGQLRGERAVCRPPASARRPAARRSSYVIRAGGSDEDACAEKIITVSAARGVPAAR